MFHVLPTLTENEVQISAIMKVIDDCLFLEVSNNQGFKEFEVNFMIVQLAFQGAVGLFQKSEPERPRILTDLNAGRRHRRKSQTYTNNNKDLQKVLKLFETLLEDFDKLKKEVSSFNDLPIKPLEEQIKKFFFEKTTAFKDRIKAFKEH